MNISRQLYIRVAAWIDELSTENVGCPRLGLGDRHDRRTGHGDLAHRR